MKTEAIRSEAQRLSAGFEKASDSTGILYTFQDAEGRYLQLDFSWGSAPYYWFWRAEKCVSEVLRRTGFAAKEFSCAAWSWSGLEYVVGFDAVNWIDDTEYNFDD